MFKTLCKILIVGCFLGVMVAQGFSIAKNTSLHYGKKNHHTGSHKNQNNRIAKGRAAFPFTASQINNISASNQQKKGSIHPPHNASKRDSVQLAFATKYSSSAVPSYDIVQSVITDVSGNVYISGNSQNIQNKDEHLLVKYNATGEYQWSRHILSGSYDVRSAVTCDNDGNIYLCGEIQMESFEHIVIRVVKYSPDGVLLWDVVTNSDPQYYEMLSEVTCNNQGDLFVCAKAYVNGLQLLTLKLSSGGNIEWTVLNETYSSADEDAHITLDSIGNPVITGECIVTDSASAEKSALVTLKLNSGDGNTLWKQYIYDESSNPLPRSGGVAQDSSGNIISAGTIRSDSTEAELVLTKYTTAGELVWTKIYQDSIHGTWDVSKDVETDRDNNIYSSSNFNNSTGNGIIIIKYNSTGEVVWSRSFTFTYLNISNFGVKIIVDKSSNIYCIGTGNVLALNSEGVVEWSHPIATFDYEYPSVGSIDNAGKIINAFTVYSDTTYEDFQIAKLEPDNGTMVWNTAQNNSFHSEDVPNIFHLDNSGNVYIYGDNGIGQEEILKYDNNGNEMWVVHNSALIPVSMDIDGEGNVFTVGRNKDSTGFYFATIKYNTAGQQQWMRKYYIQWNYQDYPEYALVKADPSGNFYICSTERPSSTKDYFLIKYSPQGTQEWVQHYSYPSAYSEVNVANLIVTNNNIVIASTTSFSDSASFHKLITTQCYNSNGNAMWISHYIPDSAWYEQSAVSVQVDNNKNIYVLGQQLAFPAPYMYFILKYDSTGVLRNKIFSDSSLSGLIDPKKILLDETGNIYVVSWHTLEKYTNTGDFSWSRGFTPPDVESFYSDANLDRSGNCFVLCNAYDLSLDYTTSIQLIKITTDGETVGVNTYNNENGDYGKAVAIDGDNNVFVLALIDDYRTSEYASAYSILLLKYQQSLLPVKDRNAISYSFSLQQNYPNPFNPLTVIRYSLMGNSVVSLKVYNILGQQVAALINNEQLEAGNHNVEFDASALASGIYFYRLTAMSEGGNQISLRKKMVLMK